MNATAQIEEVKLEQKEAAVYQVLEAKTAGGFFTALNWVYKAAEKENATGRYFFYKILRVEPEAIMATDGRRIHLYHVRQQLLPPGDWSVLQLTREIAVLARAKEPQPPVDWKKVFIIDELPFRSFSLNLWIPQKKALTQPFTALIRMMPADFTLDLPYLEHLRGFDWEVKIYSERKAVHFVNGAKEALIMGMHSDNETWEVPDFRKEPA